MKMDLGCFDHGLYHDLFLFDKDILIKYSKSIAVKILNPEHKVQNVGYIS